jgi:hypothetical protein
VRLYRIWCATCGWDNFNGDYNAVKHSGWVHVNILEEWHDLGVVEPVVYTEAEVYERKKLYWALAEVLCNASNFPDKAQSALLGRDMRPLVQKAVDAVIEADFELRGGAA